MMTPRQIARLHRDATVFLGYVNPGMNYTRDSVSARAYFTESEPWMEATTPMMRKGGVDIVTLSHGNPDESLLPGAAGVECLLKCYDALLGEIERSNHCRLVLNKNDLTPAANKGKMGIILHLTFGPASEDLAILRTYFRLGVRGAHPFGVHASLGGSAGGPKQLGLQPLGKKVIREMERLGMVVDVAHTNDRTFADVLRFARKPLIDSHTNCRAIADYDRNCTDDQLRAIAKAGGVVGAHFGFVESEKTSPNPGMEKTLREFYKKLAAMKKKYKDPYEFLRHRLDPFEWPRSIGGAVDDGTVIHRAKMSRLGDQIEHLVEIAGIDHVGIGTDYSGGSMPEGVETAETLVNLTAELVRRGFRRGDIMKIWGENFLRVYRECLPSA